MTKRLPIRFRECDECKKVFQFKNIRARFCSEACLERAWNRNHPGYMAEAQKRYLENPTHKARRRKYQKEYKQRPTSISRAAFLSNAKYKNDIEYRENKKAYVRARHQCYRINHTREQWEALKQIYGNRCAYCGRKMKRLTKDHLIPISQGDPEVVDKIENILPACKSCNCKKHTGLPFPFQRILTTEIIMPQECSTGTRGGVSHREDFRGITRSIEWH